MPRLLPDSRYREVKRFSLTKEELAKLKTVAKFLRRSQNEVLIDAIANLKFTPRRVMFIITMDLDRIARAEVSATSLGYRDAKEWFEVSLEQAIDSMWPDIQESTRPMGNRKPKPWKWGDMDTTPVIINLEEDNGEEQGIGRDQCGDKDSEDGDSGRDEAQGSEDQGEFVSEEPAGEDF